MSKPKKQDILESGSPGEPIPSQSKSGCWRLFALGITAALGLAVRLYGLDWDAILPRYQLLTRLYGSGAGAGVNFHPDERQIMYQVIKLSWPHSWAQFFDPVNSPLNPHFFAYGTFPLYLLATVGNLLAHISPALADFAHLTLTGRVLNALFDTGTILLTAWLALLLTPASRSERRRVASSSPDQASSPPGISSTQSARSWSVALLAAACVAFTPLQVQLSHFYTVDTMLLFFVVLTMLACVKLVRSEKLVRWSLVAGLGYALALATKFSAAPLLVPLLTAVCLRWYYRRDAWEFMIALIYAGCTTLLVFVVAMPYALLDVHEFTQQVAYQGDLARGLIDLPYVRQFAGTTPVVYQLQNMLLWGMGLMLGLASLAGLLWVCWRLWRHEMGTWLVLLSWIAVYGAINCSFFVKYMRYMLPLYPFLVLMGACLLISLTSLNTQNWGRLWARLVGRGSYVVIGLLLVGTLFQCLALANIYSQPNTRIQASDWIFAHLPPGTVLTYEQWDDSLPFATGNHDPFIYPQATYSNAQGQPQQGLDLYGDDTPAKAQQIAALLMQAGAITMPTDRLDKSIPRLPERYPLTIHYYQLLFSGQLGFHLAATFEDRPNFLGITLDDSGADESYSVFDHPMARIFKRDNPFPFQNADQLAAKLIQGVQLPPPDPQQTGFQKSLLLNPQQISDDQISPPFAQQFPMNSPSNSWPILFWWLALSLLGLLVYPLTFLMLRGLSDRGYLFAKTLGLLLLAYGCWLLSNWRIVAFSHLSTLLMVGLLASMALLLVVWLRRTLWAFLRERWRLFLLEECVFTLAFLLFVVIRSFNPDLWHPALGGEKPMELAFLNGILRSPYMPPLDPWFSGGSINYYYFGYIIIGALIKFTGIVPTTAFNLAIPTLFALTFSGAFSIVHSFSRRVPLALLGGYLVALLGNLDGAIQELQRLIAWLQHVPVPLFSYWQSSRVIPFTINEFPFWSFLFADLHAHVICMPLSVLLLGQVASLFLADRVKAFTKREEQVSRLLCYPLVAFVFGSIACVNPWDMPVYALIVGASMLINTFYSGRAEPVAKSLFRVGQTLCLFLCLAALSYLYYWPFYASYQQLYINGIGFVTHSTSIGAYLRIFGIWLFLAASFLLLELYRCWRLVAEARSASVTLASLWRGPAWLRVGLYLGACILALVSLAWLGVKALLVGLFVLGLLLFLLRSVFLVHTQLEQHWDARARYTYLLLLVGLALGLGIELVYIRDFLDGGDYARMNTFFKFSMQIWLCLAISGALAIGQLWGSLRGLVKRIWSLLLLLLLLGGSTFLISGTYARVQDHQNLVDYQKPVRSARYTPTLDGFAFVRVWYPGHAEAITWLNEHISGSPVLLEAAAPYDFTWFGRVAVYTGLPDVVGWTGHEGEQRYGSQPTNRLTDVSLIYTTSSSALALELLHYYHVRYIYVGDLERQAYASSSNAGLLKFERMVQEGSLQLVYRWDGVVIYKVL
ncbi:MAG TPA: DUF2298 domain-containing protein [Ktedonobacteraceae bacterium]|nr:DUF2298 domain-containing protein [Ktedonobacteraceae bacterium]